MEPPKFIQIIVLSMGPGYGALAALDSKGEVWTCKINMVDMTFATTWQKQPKELRHE